ncbi:MAG: ribose 5-phosphate isomerase B [Deltaproteobacteria bacterium]|nr:MAG: ribose 5-phosphate isomerase B [Deltaproteobacteria bacterium]
MTSPRVIVGSDHAGYDLKENLKEYLVSKGFRVEDVGPDTKDSVDYPDYAEAVASRVAGGQGDLGVLVCGTGIGMCITANKVPGIRAAILYSEFAARYARMHNDANVVIFGGRTMTPEEARKYLDVFLQEEFEGGRHRRRLEKIKRLEERNRGNCEGGKDVVPQKG